MYPVRSCSVTTLTSPVPALLCCNGRTHIFSFLNLRMLEIFRVQTVSHPNPRYTGKVYGVQVYILFIENFRYLGNGFMRTFKISGNYYRFVICRYRNNLYILRQFFPGKRYGFGSAGIST